MPLDAYAVVQQDQVGAGLAVAGLYATSDAGTSWSARTPVGGTFDGTGLAADPVAQTRLFAVERGQVVRSVDG